MQRLIQLWEQLRSSLWFLPSLIVAAAVALAFVLIALEPGSAGRLAARWPLLFGAGADGARGLLTAIATSMITVAGVTFSITVVALALTASQYTSRVIRSFIRDRMNQTVLGVFVGVFAYCLVVLRTIRGGNEDVFVPTFAVLVAGLLAFVAIGFLIFFIHHIAAAIQVAHIVEAVARETFEAVDRLFPDDLGEEAEGVSPTRQATHLGKASWRTVPARKTGYIQSVDPDELLKIARDEKTVIVMRRGIGEFVVEGSPLVAIANGMANDDLAKSLNDAFKVNQIRTVHQDAAYGIRQLVDIALKALSPGINDTTTAVNCLDYLGAILARLASRRIESPHRTGDNGVQVIACGPSFQSLLNEALDQIRQNAAGNVAVLVRLLQVLDDVRQRTTDSERLRAVREQMELVGETAARSISLGHDRAQVLSEKERLLALQHV